MIELISELYDSQVHKLLEFNPFAHRKAKVVYNFGLSECNKV